MWLGKLIDPDLLPISKGFTFKGTQHIVVSVTFISINNPAASRTDESGDIFFWFLADLIIYLQKQGKDFFSFEVVISPLLL